MKTPLRIACRNILHSEELEREIGARADELETFSGDIIGCDVMLERPHLHHEKGNACHVRIVLTIPGEEIVVSHEAGEGAEHRVARVAIHEAFDKARRLLQDAVRRQRGDVKSHAEREGQAASASTDVSST